MTSKLWIIINYMIIIKLINNIFITYLTNNIIKIKILTFIFILNNILRIQTFIQIHHYKLIK